MSFPSQGQDQFKQDTTIPKEWNGLFSGTSRVRAQRNRITAGRASRSKKKRSRETKTACRHIDIRGRSPPSMPSRTRVRTRRERASKEDDTRSREKRVRVHNYTRLSAAAEKMREHCPAHMMSGGGLSSLFPPRARPRVLIILALC